MNDHYLHLQQLEEQMEALEIEPVAIYKLAEQNIKSCQQTLATLRQDVCENGFIDKKEECAFFKTVKPKIVSYVIFFMNLIEIERSRPYGTTKAKRKFLLNQISILQSYFRKNHEFYEYYLRGHTGRDNEFFLRKNDSIKLHFDAISCFTDTQFATSHDMVLAKILGNIKTIEYLQKKLEPGPEKKPPFSITESGPNLKWTGTKVDLVELVYALHSSGMVNNGQANLNVLAKAFETLFQKDMGDLYRTFLEIRTRKTNPSKLLDILKTSLLQRIIQADA